MLSEAVTAHAPCYAPCHVTSNRGQK